MKKIKLITSIAALATVGTTVGILASCNKGVNIKVDGGSYDQSKSKIALNTESTIVFVPKTGEQITGLNWVKVGGKKLTSKQYNFTVDNANSGTLVIVKEAMTSLDIEVSLQSAPEEAVVTKIISVTGPTGVTENDYIKGSDFTINVEFDDKTTGTISVGEKCKVFNGSDEITTQLTSTEGYKVTQSDTLTLTFKAGKNFDKTADCIVSVQPAATLTGISVAEAKSGVIYTKQGVVKPSDFVVTATYDKIPSKTITSGYEVYVGTDPITDFFTNGYTLTQNVTLKFVYGGQEATKSLTVTVTDLSIDPVLADDVEIKTPFDPDQRTVTIGPKASIITPITEISSITKGTTTLSSSDYEDVITSGNHQITFKPEVMKILGDIVITPAVHTITELEAEIKVADFTPTTGGVITSEIFNVKGKYGTEGSVVLAYNQPQGYAAYVDDNQIDLTQGYTFASAGSLTITFKLLNLDKQPITTITAASIPLTIKDVNASIPTTITEATAGQFIHHSGTGTGEVKISPTGQTKDITGFAVDSIVKGGQTLTPTTDYTTTNNGDGTWTITLTATGLAKNGDLVITPTIGDALYTIDTEGTTKGFVAMTEAGKKQTGTVTIPKTVRGETVTGIKDNGCVGCQAEQIKFGGASNITTIGEGAFSGSQIQVFYLPNKITKIQKSTFKSCSKLQKVSITGSSSLQSIESEAFANCGQLHTFDINSNLQTIGDNAFNMCTSLTDLTDPDLSQLKSIGNNAFYGCSLIGFTFKLPSTIESIGAGAFGSTSIQSVTISGATSTDHWIQNKGASYIDVSVGTTNATNLKKVTGSKTPDGTNWGDTGIKKQDLGTLTVTDNQNGHEIDINDRSGHPQSIKLSSGGTAITGATIDENNWVIMEESKKEEEKDKGIYYLHAKSGLTASGSTTITIRGPECDPTPWDIEVATFHELEFDETNAGKIVNYGAAGPERPKLYLPNRHWDGSKFVYVTEIEAGAFWYHEEITNVTLPKQLTKIGANAFENCPALCEEGGTVTFGDTTKTWKQTGGTASINIKDDTHQNALNLTCIDEQPEAPLQNWGRTGIEEMKEQFDVADDQHICNDTASSTFIIRNKSSQEGVDPDTIEYSNPGIVTLTKTATPGSLTITPVAPGSTKIILKSAEYETLEYDIEVGSFQQMSFDETTNTVSKKDGAIYNTTLNIPSRWYRNGQFYNVEHIAESAFASNDTVTTVTLPATLTSIGKKAFEGCTALTSATFLDDIKLWMQTDDRPIGEITDTSNNAACLIDCEPAKLQIGHNWGYTGIERIEFDLDKLNDSVYTSNEITIKPNITYKFNIKVLNVAGNTYKPEWFGCGSDWGELGKRFDLTNIIATYDGQETSAGEIDGDIQLNDCEEFEAGKIVTITIQTFNTILKQSIVFWSYTSSE